jgi:hypothetical protein
MTWLDSTSSQLTFISKVLRSLPSQTLKALFSAGMICTTPDPVCQLMGPDGWNTFARQNKQMFNTKL